MDNFIVSARKYRPATFDMVVGQSAITATLRNAIRNNILAQAFLFTGPRGVGKTTCARIMAKTINCLNPTPDMEACDQCESCVSFRNSASFNIHELDAASNNSVDDIRALVDQVRIPPQVGKYKIYIIDEVHMLSQAAFNAFLKTLEEPPSYAKFILATTEKHKIIPTILSRCQIFDFRRITLEDTVKHLQYVAEKEGVTTETDALNIIAQKADGAMRDALSIFDQMVSFSGNSITYKDVISNLNVLDYEYYFKMTDAVLQSETSSALLILNEIIDNGFDGQHFITGMGSHLRSLLVSKDAETVKLLEVSQSLRDRYAAQAASCTQSFLFQTLNISNQCDLNYARSSNKRLLLEIALLQMCAINQSKQEEQTAKPPNIAAPQTTSTSQTIAPAAAQVKVSVSPPVVTHPSTGYETKAAPSPPPPREAVGTKPRGARTMSIASSEDESDSESTEIAVMDTPFTQEQLQQAWDEFPINFQSVSPSFLAAMKRYTARKGEANIVYFEADNPLIFADKINFNTLLDHLKSSLKNNQIVIEPVIKEIKEEKKIAFTDKEKLERMIELRPMLQLFKDELGLEAES
jgi:DNA polymerase-3 subunit gamma/tau